MKMYKDINDLSDAVKNGEVHTPKKAIEAKCLDCSAYQVGEVRQCVVTDCPLYAFRLGKNPYRKKQVMSEERIAAATQNLLKYRKRKEE